MAGVNRHDYLYHRNQKSKNKTGRTWWLGIQPLNVHITLPKRLLGKRLRFKVEDMDKKLEEKKKEYGVIENALFEARVRRKTK